MKTEKPMQLEDVELYPDAMERLERAVKIAARHPPIKRQAAKTKGGKPKPRNPRPTRRP